MFVPKIVEKFSITSQWLKQSGALRLDASFYNPRVAHAIDTLKKCGIPLSTVSKVTERVFIPGRFARTYVEKEHGVPFLQGGHVVHFQPADLKYISSAVHKQIEKWIIHENWILITRSGTVGRVAITPELWDGWAASEHILRVIPKENSVCSAGYLYAYLSSPLGQAQLTAQIYGAVVDELTEDQVRAILIPVPETDDQLRLVNDIAETAMLSMQRRVEAMKLADKAIEKISRLIPIPEPEIPRGQAPL